MNLVFAEIMKSSSIPREEIDETHEEIFNETLKASMQLPEGVAVLRPSYLNFKNVVQWGGTVENGLAASLMTLNSDHGPFKAAYEMISRYFHKDLDFVRNHAIILIKNAEIIPGFGNPILKHRDDRTIGIKSKIPNKKYDRISDTIEKVIKEKKGQNVYSNLAFWSAASCHALGLPSYYASCIPIIGFQLKYFSTVQSLQ